MVQSKMHGNLNTNILNLDLNIIMCISVYYYGDYQYIVRYKAYVTTKAVISNTGIFVAIDNNTLYGSKLSVFLLCHKSLGY